MQRQLRPVKLVHVLLTAAILGLSTTLLSEFFYSEVLPGKVDYGFPLPWKRVYGGEYAVYNYVYFVADFIIWTIILFTLIVVVFKFGLGWKPS